MIRRALGVAAALAALSWAFAPGPARAQGNYGVTSADGLDVWAVGDSGRFYRSFDGGANWSFGNLGSKRLRAVAVRGFRVFVVGDSGHVWMSTNSGGAWTLRTAAGAPTLRAIDMPNDTVGYVAGDNGALLKLTGFGDTLTALASGTSARLNGVRFADGRHGWVVGSGGYAASTADGGAHWATSSLGTTNDLNGVDEAGSTIWIVGDNATARLSVDGGTSFSPVDLKLAARADVRAVRLATADTVTLGGGGGFVRRSVDGGQTWSFFQHPLQGPLTAIAFAARAGFACTSASRAVVSSQDGGATWSLPAGTTATRTWTRKLGSQFPNGSLLMRGQTFALNPVYKSEIYVLLGFFAGYSQLWESHDDGENWFQIGNQLNNYSKSNAFVMSPRDSNTTLAAVADPGAVLKSTDNFKTWSDKLDKDFGEYAIPLEMDPDHPDTVLFGADTTRLHRSTDFGDTWNLWSNTIFREPDDLLILPDSSNVVLVGDGVTGVGNQQIYQSTDRGVNFTSYYTGTGSASEAPGLTASRLQPTTVFATAWSEGGVQRSLDAGLSWTAVNGANAAWGVDIARDDPNLVLFGVFSGGQSYLSFDAGNTFTAIPLTGANYTFFARDRATILAEQSNGIWKLGTTYSFTPSNAQSVTLTAPNGGEVWNPGQVNTITWSSANLAIAHLEYRSSPSSSWHAIADVAGDAGRYDWTVPIDPGTHAVVRISDGWDGAPSDTSNAQFTITTGVGVAPNPPGAWTLEPAQPNPFQRSTLLRYSLPARARVRLEVFNVKGERVATLVDGWQEPGMYSASFRSEGTLHGRLASGVYFARLRAGPASLSRKLLLMR
jgi:photosystem II stability/assembly factor-like uncharacterized protein